jgi:hypothetical protein
MFCGDIMKYGPPRIESKTMKDDMRKIVPESDLIDEIMDAYRRGDGENCLENIELYQILYGSE